MAVSRPSVSGFARLTHWESPWVTSNPEIVGRRPEGLRYGLEKMGMVTPWDATSIPERAGAFRKASCAPCLTITRYSQLVTLVAAVGRIS
jgi:hypothetical protein